MKNIIFSLALTAAFFAHAAHAGLYDDFTNPKWTAFSTEKKTSVYQNGVLNISIPKNAPVGFGGYVSTCRLDGDFDVSVDFKTNSVGDPAIALVVGTTPFKGVDDGVFHYLMSRVTSNGVVIYSSSLDPRYANYVETADLKGKFRLVRTGSHIESYYSSKGKWVALGGTEIPAPTEPMYFGLQAWGGVTSKALLVQFDNVYINQGTCI